MVLVGPSLGAAVAIDFSINYPEAVHAQTNFVHYICKILFTIFLYCSVVAQNTLIYLQCFL